MDSKDGFLAAKILVDFIRDFTSLAEHQLLAIRGMMESTVQEVMASVTNISSTANSKKIRANEVLVKTGDSTSDQFVNASSEEVDRQQSEEGQNRKVFLENRLRRAGGVFSKHMEVLGTMDSAVQDLLIKVVGSVSMDDVMAQRLSHVIASVNLLRVGLAEVVGNYGEFQTQKKVKELRNRILTEVYLSYTAEEEKEIFHKIFGQPKSMQKVS